MTPATIARWGASLVLGLLVWGLSHLGIELDSEQHSMLLDLLATVLTVVVTMLANRYGRQRQAKKAEPDAEA